MSLRRDYTNSLIGTYAGLGFFDGVFALLNFIIENPVTSIVLSIVGWLAWKFGAPYILPASFFAP